MDRADSCLLVAGINVAVSVPTTLIITAIASSIITCWCCIKRTSPAEAALASASDSNEHELCATTTDTSCAAAVNPAYGHFGDLSRAQ